MASAASNVSLLSKFKGCMIGALIGDCIGGPFEGDAKVSKLLLGKYFHALLKGESSQTFSYTDDTAMTLSVANSLLENKGVDPKDMATRFVTEYYKNPKRGYGNNVVGVFRALKESEFEDVFLPAKLQFGGAGSYGNGAAMRVAPIALYGYRKSDEFIRDAVEKCSRVTHTHPNGVNGAIHQCLAVHAALKCDPSQPFNPPVFCRKLEAKMKIVEKHRTKGFNQLIGQVEEIFLQEQKDILTMSSEEIAEYLGNDISAIKSVPTALFTFLRGSLPISSCDSKNPFARSIYFAISLGGDTDTIASMAGAIAGAYYGIEAIPVELQRRCEAIDEVTKLAEQLYEAAEKNK